MVIGIISNGRRDKDFQTAHQLEELCAEFGISVFVSEEIVGCKAHSLPIVKLAETCDFIMVLGGDGTILRASENLIGVATPILGINLGRLGFLTESDAGGLRGVLTKLVQGDYFLDKRYFLNAVCQSHQSYSLNEVLLERGSDRNIVDVSLYVDGTYVDKYSADGVIVSTPTGSTAYNLAAGGPILSPDIDALVICPICPHSLYMKPLVISDSHEVKLVANSIARLIIDGRYVCTAKSQDSVVITQSERSVSFVRFDKTNFFVRLKSKLYSV